MAFPYPIYTLQSTITPQCDVSGGTLHCDISGVPVYSPHTGGTYFAVAARGTMNGQYSNQNYYTIFVGSTDLSGNVLWTNTFSNVLQPDTNAWNPYIITGPNDELFLAYSTDGSIPSGFHIAGIDNVVARIDVVANVPQVTWAIQNVLFNSAFDDITPILAIDSKYNYLYLAWTRVNGAQEQVFVSCFSFQGTQRWITLQPPYRTDYMNNTGPNRAPSITTDNDGSVYIAYETSGVRPSSSVVIPYQQVDVVKFTTVPGIQYTYTYDWTLSERLPHTNLWAIDGYCYKPSISYTQDKLILSFLTSGTITTRTNSELDIVIAALSEAGSIYWVRQGLPYGIPIKNIFQFSLSTMSPYIYICAVTNTQTTQDSVLAWKLNDFDGTPIWNYNNQVTAYGYAETGSPNAVFASASYSFFFSSIQAAFNRLYLSAFTFIRLEPAPPIVPPRWFTLSELVERKYATNYTAYSYLTLDCSDSCV